MSAHEPHLLWTKLETPPPGRHYVARPQLLARIDAELDLRLIVLCAPAGYGKTTLLASWCHALGEQGVRSAWLTLDEAENDLARFLAYLTAACAQLVPLPTFSAAGEEVLRGEAGVALVLTNLLNALAAAEHPIVLVLDDYHVITTPAVHAAVAFLLDHLPAQLRLALGTRADPPLQLARLRVREQLLELRTSELRFTADDVQRFFQQANNVVLHPSDADAITAHVEGWPAGVQLVSLALRGLDHAASAQTNAAGYRPMLGPEQLARGQEHVFAYLADEVLGRQAPSVQQFLIYTAVLDRLTGSLCEAVLSPRVQLPVSAGQMLEALDHASLFVTALDHERRWYRYHQLFRTFLLTRLAQEPDDLVAELYQRASHWCAGHGLPHPAVAYALAGGDLEGAAELIARLAEGLITRGEYGTLHGWLDQLPEDVRQGRPELDLWAAWAALFAGEVERIEPLLARAVRAWSAAGDGGKLGAAAHLEAHLARLRSEPAATIDAAARALVLLPVEEHALRAGSLLALGAGHLLAGQLDQAERLLHQARADCQTHNFLGLLVTMVWLGDLALHRGELRAAEVAYQEALHAAGNRAIWGRWEAVLRLGELARERNALGQARTLLQEGLAALEETGTAVYATLGEVALARTQWACGESGAAYDSLDRGLHRAQQLGSQQGQRTIRAWQARLALASGNLPSATRWRQQAALSRESIGELGREVELLTMARVLLAEGKGAPHHPAIEQARLLLAALGQAAEGEGRMRSQIEILVLDAVLQQETGNGNKAVQRLGQALVLAEPEGFARVFLDEGPPLKQLLRRVASSLESGARYATRLLALFEQEHLRQPSSDGGPRRQGAPAWDSCEPTTLVEALSEREREVLLLVSAGASNQAIADALVISIGTVKSHINHILGKLEADNRTAAVSRARTLGLLAN